MLMRFSRRVWRKLVSFHRASQAVAAVEFAVVLPFAILLYFGAAEVADGVVVSRKISMVTRTLVDLTSQQPAWSQDLSYPTPQTPLTASTLSTIMTGSATLLYPKASTSLTMTLSAVDIANTITGVCCSATVRWSYTQGGTLRPCGVLLTPGDNGATGQVRTFPTDLMPIGTPLPSTLHFLVADVGYTYQPIATSGYLNFAPTMARVEYMMPRSIGQVITGALPLTGAQHGLVCY